VKKEALIGFLQSGHANAKIPSKRPVSILHLAFITNIKYSSSYYMACTANPISQPSLDFSPIWIPIISDEVTNSHRRSV
jgi:hypothetical protein